MQRLNAPGVFKLLDKKLISILVIEMKCSISKSVTNMFGEIKTNFKMGADRKMEIWMVKGMSNVLFAKKIFGLRFLLERILLRK